MASQVLIAPSFESLNDDNDTDYGSDFSAGEEEIVSQLLSGAGPISPAIVEEDNPITTEIEHHDTQQTLRLPRIYPAGERSPLLQAARAAEQVAEQLSRVIARERYPDCMSLSSINLLSYPMFLLYLYINRSD